MKNLPYSIKSQVALGLWWRCRSLEKSTKSILSFSSLLYNNTKISFFLELISDLFRSFTTSFRYTFQYLLMANHSLLGLVFWSEFHNKEVKEISQFGGVVNNCWSENISDDLLNYVLRPFSFADFNFLESSCNKPERHVLTRMMRRVFDRVPGRIARLFNIIYRSHRSWADFHNLLFLLSFGLWFKFFRWLFSLLVSSWLAAGVRISVLFFFNFNRLFQSFFARSCGSLQRLLLYFVDFFGRQLSFFTLEFRLRLLRRRYLYNARLLYFRLEHTWNRCLSWFGLAEAQSALFFHCAQFIVALNS